MAYDHASGLELWTSDGTSAGTKLFKDCYAGVNSGVSVYNQNIARTKDYLYFCGQRNQTEGFELFYTKENAESLDLLRDLEPLNGSSSSPRLVEGNDSFFAYNLSQVAFTTNVSFDDNSAFFGNDTNIRYSNIEAIYPIGNQYIVKAETDHYGTELFSCDKHLKNPVLLKDINPGSASGIHYNIHTINDKAYFVGFSNLMLYDIWITDGTYDGTKIYHEITGGNAPVVMTWNNRLFFVGKMDESVGDELYELNSKNYTISQFNNQENTVFPNPAKAGESLKFANGACHISCFNQLGQIAYIY
jgi:ELWxxDGT repeat protein